MTTKPEPHKASAPVHKAAAKPHLESDDVGQDWAHDEPAGPSTIQGLSPELTHDQAELEAQRSPQDKAFHEQQDKHKRKGWSSGSKKDPSWQTAQSQEHNPQ
jgi:hypothetical protein